MKYVFTCGGTAGHINPALAIASRIRELEPDAEFLFIGTPHNMEKDLVPMAGFDFKSITITNLRRSFKPKAILHNINTVKNIPVSSHQVRKILKEFKPDVAVGTGGYVCYPVLKQAHKLGINTVVHEANAFPGLTTRMLEKSCDTILVGFEESRNFYKEPDKVECTGTPVRPEFDDLDHVSAKRELGFSENTPLAVSFWGSLGADHMNEITAEMFANGIPEGVKLIHATGGGDAGVEKMQSRVKALGAEIPAGVDLRPYIYDMSRVMVAADLIICRAGASTLAELVYLGKPAILVPSPYVTNNHQEKNAQVLERAGGAVLLREPELDGKKLGEEIVSLLGDSDRLAKMSEGLKSISTPDTLDRIVKVVMDAAKAE